jgi:hypothetical protein
MRIIEMPAIVGRVIDDLENVLGFEETRSQFGGSEIYTRWDGRNLRWTRSSEPNGYQNAYRLSYGRFGPESQSVWGACVELSIDCASVHAGRVPTGIHIKTEIMMHPSWTPIYTLQFSTTDTHEWQRHAYTLLNIFAYADSLSEQDDTWLSGADTDTE